MLKLSLVFEPKDAWIGVYHDTSKRTLYLFVVPFIGLKIEYGGSTKLSCQGCGKPAEWKGTILKILQGEFGRFGFYCSECMDDAISGGCTGGGTPFYDFEKIERLNVNKVKIEDLYSQSE